MAAKIQIAGLFTSSRQEDDDEDPSGVAADFAEEVVAAGKGRLRIANASSRRNSATDPRNNGSNL
jgi:hypothetical protein